MEIAQQICRQGGFFTSARLQNIRRILFSAGTGGRSRTDQHLSGLRFEFYNSERESIVGQWFEQVDYLDLPEGDSIAHIKVWYTQEANPANTLHENNGKVVGIAISTFKGARKEVLLHSSKTMLCNDYHANAFERLVRGDPVLYPSYRNTNTNVLQDALIWGFNTILIISRSPGSSIHGMIQKNFSSSQRAGWNLVLNMTSGGYSGRSWTRMETRFSWPRSMHFSTPSI